jgi:hypothetical protein
MCFEKQEAPMEPGELQRFGYKHVAPLELRIIVAPTPAESRVCRFKNKNI